MLFFLLVEYHCVKLAISQAELNLSTLIIPALSASFFIKLFSELLLSSNNVLKKKKEGFHERKREVACWP